MQGHGFLIIWSDVDPAHETDYLHWLTREHAAERVSIPGFLAVRIFRALRPDVRRFVMNYELETAAVVDSPAYLARLNDPTPWTQKTMPRLRNFVRGGGRRLHSAGVGRGGYMTALSLPAAMPPEGEALVAALAACDRISAVHLYATDSSRTAVQTREKDTRAAQPGAGDPSYAGVLFIEGLDEQAIEDARRRLRQINPELERESGVGALTYATIYDLDARQLTTPG